MKLAYRAYAVTLLLLTFVFAVSAQTPNVSGGSAPTYDKNARSAKDDRNTAPTVGTGGPVGGPTGLFTVYDGQTLRKGEWTLSAAISNYDRDPGNADFTEIPLSVQYGVTNRIEVFFSTTALRGVHVNSPRNLSSFYLPNSQFAINGALQSAPAIILSPQGAGTSLFPNTAIFRPTGTQPYGLFPYSGLPVGTLGFSPPFFSGPQFGFPAGTNALINVPRPGGGGGADLFPGLGSVFGGILPGVVLQTTTLVNRAGAPSGEGPLVFALAPSYLEDAPFINRTWGTSTFDDYTGGVKLRFTNPNNPVGVGVIAYYKYYADHANDASGFNQLQRGAGPGGNHGDIGVVGFADIRLKRWANLSGNIGYSWNSKVKGDFPNGTFVLLDRPNEVLAAIGADFPINRWFQPILEFRSLEYVGGHTPNAFEQNPMDFIGGFRVWPARWIGIGVAYRYNVNQQDADSFKSGDSFTNSVVVNCTPNAGSTNIPCSPVTISQSFSGIPPGFTPSDDPHGYILQLFAGRRNKRIEEQFNKPANVTALTLSSNSITLGCPAGQVPVDPNANCGQSTSINVTTTAVDPENDVLTYQYTVTAGRVVGTGANVSWDLSGVAPGTYTITAGVDDGCGICGATKTQTVTIAPCNCKVACSCPSITVTGPAGITAPGGTMTFTANASGGTSDQQLTYNWTVSAGTITSGQGTPSIVVTAPSDNSVTNITATVTLGGLDPSCNCPNTASETAGVSQIMAQEVDTFGNLKPDDIKARIQAFYSTQLANNPTAQGYIINYGTPKEIAKRRADIMKAITFLKLDPSRVTFVDGTDKGTGPETHLWLVPPGANPPTP